MKKLTTLTLALGVTLLLGACSGAKEETTVFKQDIPELQGENLGASSIKITHKGEKISEVVYESTTPLTMGVVSAEETQKAIKEIEADAKMAQEEKDKLIAEMQTMSAGNPEEQAAEMAKNLDSLYDNMPSSKGIAVKTKKSKASYSVTITVDLAKADKSKLGQVFLPVDFSKVKDYKDAEKELKTLQFKAEK